MSNANQMTTAERSRAFKATVLTSASRLLTEWVGEERAKEATGRISSAFSASALAARDPSDFYACTPASVALCVATAALTGIMPGSGASALAYLVPRRPRKNEAPQLNYQLSHRGLCALARRAGLVLIAIPAGADDPLELEDGEVSTFSPSIDNPPLTWEELRGVVVVVKDASTGVALFRGWVPLKIIDQRRQMSDSFKWADKGPDWKKKNSTWHKWAVEMAMKTALHYAVSRGWAVIDDTEAVRALSVDAAGDVIDADFTDVEAKTGADALGLGLDDDDAAPQLEDRQPERDLEDAAEEASRRRAESREPVKAKPEPKREPVDDGPPGPPSDFYDDPM